MRGHRLITDGERLLAIDMARAGMLYREIAQVTERPQGTICRMLSDAILEGRLDRRYERTEVRTDRVYQKYG